MLETTRPQSMPTGAAARPTEAADAPSDAAHARGPGRLQLVVAGAVGLSLVAVPLYLVHRAANARAEGGAGVVKAADPVAPRAPAAAVPGAGPGTSDVSCGDGGAPSVGSRGPTLTLSEFRVLECHDPGPRRTPADQCDHLAVFEQAYAKALQDAAACAAPALAGENAGGGTLAYVVDVSFARKRAPYLVSTPRGERTLKSSKVVATCAAALKRGLSALPLAGVPHGHSRYKVAVTASYGPAGLASSPAAVAAIR